MWRRLKLAGLLSISAVLTACGSPGVPLPPSLELPRPVTDLRASRKGNKVDLTWTLPTQTTEHQNLRRGVTVEICREVGAIKNCKTPLARIPFHQVSANAPAAEKAGKYTDDLSSTQFLPTSGLVYAISVVNPYGRSAGLSNEVSLPAAPTLSAPSGFRAQVTADGVQLSWNPVQPPQISGLRFLYRAYRRELGTNKDALAGELPVENQPSPSLLDHGFEWEKTYDYRVTVVTVISSGAGEQLVEGDDTSAQRVFAHDVFPPATPTGLQAVFSGPGQKPFIDLVWSPNTEPDLAGYYIYRRENGAAWTKLNSDPVKSPAFRDPAIEPGHQYTYAVSAVDVRGNESSHSEEASETVP